MEYFKNIVGQKKAINKLIFSIESFNRGGLISPILFQGAFGGGKTMLSRKLAENIFYNGEAAKFFEVNASTIKNVDDFIQQVFYNFFNNNFGVILIDEAHLLKDDIQNLLLTVLNVESDPIRKVNWKDKVITVDLRKSIFVFATTNPEKIVDPLRNRLEIVDIVPYSLEELGSIIKMNTPDISYDNNILEAFSLLARMNARSAVKLSQKINSYAKIYEINTINLEHFNNLCLYLSILPYGLTEMEKMVLKVIAESGECTLSHIASKTNLSRSMIQKDAESYLVKLGFIELDGKRKITSKGAEIIKALE